MTRRSLAAVLAGLLTIGTVGLVRAHGGLAAQPGETMRSVWDGVYTETQAKRGDALYRQRCVLCHGVELTGGESAPPLAGPTFSANWNGLTVGDLAERMRVSMPPEQPGAFSRQQYADVVAFVLKENQFPAGEQELARGVEVLKQIRFESTKPAQQ